MPCVQFKAAVPTVDLFVGVAVHDENGDAWSASAGILVHLAYAVTVQRLRLSWTWLGGNVESDRLPKLRARASSISRRDPKLRSAERPRSAAGSRALTWRAWPCACVLGDPDRRSLYACVSDAWHKFRGP